MSNSLNASVIDPNYPVRSIYAQQWVNIITSLVFYTILYFSYFSCTCKLILKNPIVRIDKRIVLYCIVLGEGGEGIQHKLPKKACLTFKITFLPGQFWLSINALKYFKLFRRHFLRKRVKKSVI